MFPIWVDWAHKNFTATRGQKYLQQQKEYKIVGNTARRIEFYGQIEESVNLTILDYTEKTGHGTILRDLDEVLVVMMLMIGRKQASIVWTQIKQVNRTK